MDLKEVQHQRPPWGGVEGGWEGVFWEGCRGGRRGGRFPWGVSGTSELLGMRSTCDLPVRTAPSHK